jgi:predicted RNA-binding Zn-ribbon protein involved in translation (DUF1610 family)
MSARTILLPRSPKIDPMCGISVMKCKGCRKKFVTYGKSLCSYCSKEK